MADKPEDFRYFVRYLGNSPDPVRISLKVVLGWIGKHGDYTEIEYEKYQELLNNVTGQVLRQ